MSTMQATRTMGARGHRGLTDLVCSALAALHKEIRIRRSMIELSGMDERMLRDLGLTRGDAERAVRHGHS